MSILISMFRLISRLHSKSSQGVGAKAQGSGINGGYVSFPQMLSYIAEGGWNLRWDEQGEAPFVVKGLDWITYENEASIEKKVRAKKVFSRPGQLRYFLPLGAQLVQY